MKVAIVKYNAGNVQSVRNALVRLGVEFDVTDNAETLHAADKVIFPGVGEASSAMKYLRERKLEKVIASLQQPVLGICLGMHLLCTASEENDTECLGVLPYRVKRFSNDKLKVPQIGWNNISNFEPPLFDGVHDNAYVYFVHGFYVEKGPETIATAQYGLEFSAGINTKNFYAVQFHPEKSGVVGEKILKNFLQAV
jgi:glutamine amidotransferase